MNQGQGTKGDGSIYYKIDDIAYGLYWIKAERKNSRREIERCFHAIIKQKKVKNMASIKEKILTNEFISKASCLSFPLVGNPSAERFWASQNDRRGLGYVVLLMNSLVRKLRRYRKIKLPSFTMLFTSSEQVLRARRRLLKTGAVKQ